MIRQMDKPMQHTVIVPMDIDLAFITFATRLADWLPLSSFNPEENNHLVIQPQAGGSCLTGSEDGTMTEWGHVRVWDSPHRFVLARKTHRHEAEPPSAGEVEVRFIAEGPSKTRVELEHNPFAQSGNYRREKGA